MGGELCLSILPLLLLLGDRFWCANVSVRVFLGWCWAWLVVGLAPIQLWPPAVAFVPESVRRFLEVSACVCVLDFGNSKRAVLLERRRFGFGVGSPVVLCFLQNQVCVLGALMLTVGLRVGGGAPWCGACRAWVRVDVRLLCQAGLAV